MEPLRNSKTADDVQAEASALVSSVGPLRISAARCESLLAALDRGLARPARWSLPRLALGVTFAVAAAAAVVVVAVVERPPSDEGPTARSESPTERPAAPRPMKTPPPPRFVPA